jgi:hypothetical protein
MSNSRQRYENRGIDSDKCCLPAQAAVFIPEVLDSVRFVGMAVVSFRQKIYRHSGGRWFG